MKSVVCLVLILYLGGTCLSNEISEDSSSSNENEVSDLESFLINHQEQLLEKFALLADGPNMTPEEAAQVVTQAIHSENSSSQESSENLDEFLKDHLDKVVEHFAQLADGQNMTPEEAGAEIVSNVEADTNNSMSINKKCFWFWPWSWGCIKRICYNLGAYAYYPVCGHDTSLGYKSFHNYCWLNATNTCYSTNYILNSTGVC